MGERSHVDHRARADLGVQAEELHERPLVHEPVGAQHPLDDDLGVGGHGQVDRATGDQREGRAAQARRHL